MVGCLDDIATVVQKSAKVNVPQLHGRENGDVILPTYNWKSFLSAHIKLLPGIKKYTTSTCLQIFQAK